jgi:hypothetical protein
VITENLVERVARTLVPFHALHEHVLSIDPALKLTRLPNTGLPVVDVYGVLGEGETGERSDHPRLGVNLWTDETGESAFALMPMEIVREGRIVLVASTYGGWARYLQPVTRDFVEILLLDDGRWVLVGPRNKTGPKKWPTHDLFEAITAGVARKRALDEGWARLQETDTAPWEGAPE